MGTAGDVRRGAWWGGPLTVVAAVGAVLLVQGLAVTLLPAPPQFLHDFVEPAAITAVLVTVAVVVCAIVRHEAQDPIRAFGRIAFVALLVSLLPDVAVGLGWVFRGEGWTLASVFIAQHVAAYVVTVRVLARLMLRR